MGSVFRATDTHKTVPGNKPSTAAAGEPPVLVLPNKDTHPHKVGPYSIISLLGYGGMAAVYKARGRRGGICALKVLYSNLLDDHVSIAQFLREAETLKPLAHPVIVKLHDFRSGDDGGAPYICLEFVDGRSLESVIKGTEPLPTSYAAGIISETARALAYIHSRGITHLDLKPANIMLTGKGEPKLMDLGVDRTYRIALSSTAIPENRAVHCVAPEVIQSGPGDKDKVDGRADLYSLGVILYQLLTCRQPFEADDPVKIIFMALTGEPVTPSTYNGLIPAELEAIVLKMMSRDQGSRFSTADEIIAALERFCP